MERTFSRDLIEAVKKCANDRCIALIHEGIMSSSTFLEAEERNKWRAPTVCYILPDGTVLERLSEEKRKELSEFAAIIDMESEFFFVEFIYND